MNTKGAHLDKCLRVFMRRHSMTLLQVSHHTGLSTLELKKMEHKPDNFTETAKALAEGFRIPLSYFLKLA